MEILQDAGIDNVFFWINPVEKCTQSFPRSTSTEDKWRHDVYWSLRSQRRLLSSNCCVKYWQSLTRTGLRYDINVQYLLLSSMSACRTASFSVFSRMRYFSFTSCMALSIWLWILDLPTNESLLCYQYGTEKVLKRIIGKNIFSILSRWLSSSQVFLASRVGGLGHHGSSSKILVASSDMRYCGRSAECWSIEGAAWEGPNGGNARRVPLARKILGLENVVDAISVAEKPISQRISERAI
jgi:hypothetical protein